MPTLAELLDPSLIKALGEMPTVTPVTAAPVAVAVKVEAALPAIDLTRNCMCERRHDGFLTHEGVIVHKGCGRPRKTTAALRGAAVVPLTARCACGASVTVIARADSEQRKTVCISCARAMTPNNVREDKMKFDLSTISNEDLGALVRASMIAEQVSPLTERVAVAVEQRKVEAAVVKGEQQVVRNDLISIGVLDGFTLHKVEVPALDVSAVPNIDEVPAAKFRSPYNKIRNRLGEPLHRPGNDAAEQASTWRNLVDDHQRFAVLANQPETPVETHKRLHATPVEALEKAPKATKVKAVAVTVDLDEKAKVKALRKAMGCTKAEAREMLAAIS